MKLRFIFNPRSGRNARRPWLAPLIAEFIRARSLDATLVTTRGPGHATELARDALAAGCTRVIAVGGDGTMNEVAQALLHSEAALGLVPCGSGNGLALHLGLPLGPAVPWNSLPTRAPAPPPSTPAPSTNGPSSTPWASVSMPT